MDPRLRGDDAQVGTVASYSNGSAHLQRIAGQCRSGCQRSALLIFALRKLRIDERIGGRDEEEMRAFFAEDVR